MLNREDPLAFLSKSAILILSIYILISSNILLGLLSCRMRKLIVNSMVIKHCVGIFLFFVLNVITDSDVENKDIVYIIGLTLITYIWFVLTTKMPLGMSLVVIGLIITIFALKTYNKYYSLSIENDLEKEKCFKTIEQLQNILAIFTFILTIIGVFMYYNEKIKKYREKFKLFDFVIGTPHCSNPNGF